MTLGNGSRVSAHTLLSYLEGELSASERAVVDERRAESAAVRDHLERLRRVRERLLTPLSGATSVDLVDAVHHAARRRPREVTRRRFSTPLALASAASLLLVVGGALSLHDPVDAPVTPPFGENVSEFRAKSAAQREARDWVDIQVYQLVGEGAPLQVTDHIEAGAALLFSYVNLSTPPLGYLMIFAVAEAGDVFWFHPARADDGRDATSLPIERSGAQMAIPELIRYALPPGLLQLYAVFTDRPLRVRDVEGWLSEHPWESFTITRGEGQVRVVRARVGP